MNFPVPNSTPDWDEFPKLPSLDAVIKALEAFQCFELQVRKTAIVLYAKEIGIPQIHFYAIAAILASEGAL